MSGRAIYISWALTAWLLLTSGQRGGSIIGTVTGPDGMLMPGVTVQASRREGGLSMGAHTDSAGRYALAGLPSGTYEISAQLPGFCTQRQTVVRPPGAAPQILDFSLQLSPVQTVMKVQFPLAEDFARADVVAHVRITRSYEPAIHADPSCGSVATEHEILILEVAKLATAEWPDAPRVRILQPHAGTIVVDGQERTGQFPPFEVGDEFVAFFHWSPNVAGFLPGETLRVEDGGVRTQQPRQDEFQDRMPVHEFLEMLRSLQ